jgi:large subunit ribosomal protein L29
LVKIEEIRALDPGELNKKLDEDRHELLNLRFRLATKQLVNHREVRVVKKRIARMETILREKAEVK